MKLGLEQRARGTCRDDPMSVQCFSVVLCPSQQVLFLIVMGNDRDGLHSRHSDDPICHEGLPLSSEFVDRNRMQ